MKQNPIFITEVQRQSLEEAYIIIEATKKSITPEYEEYSSLKTCLYYLKMAIEDEKTYY
ncbi:hypothetical protein ACFRH9_17195 [Peribacillus butanolivorans]|uniref:hypothetical protein n=1 Tax=Peribacillus butanolivorans TaxID=421767 RepID=UPI00366CF66B